MPNSVTLVIESFLDLRRVILHLTRAVASPRPEESSETVATTPRHNVYVQVGDRLADDIVDRNERPLSSKRVEKRASDVLRGRQQRLHQALRQLEQRVDVLQRSDEHVSLEDRPVVKECDHFLGAEDDGRVELTAADLAEHIVSHWHDTSASATTFGSNRDSNKMQR